MKLVAPYGFVSAEIAGAVYEADEDGNVAVTNEEHAAIMLSPAHGFKYHPDDQDEHAPVPESGAPSAEQLKQHEEALANDGGQGGAGGEGDDGKSDGPENGVSVSEDDIREMNKVDLIDFIEERGGEIEGKPSKEELIDQALALRSKPVSE